MIRPEMRIGEGFVTLIRNPQSPIGNSTGFCEAMVP